MNNYISVIIIAYDRKEFLLEALKSTVNQTLDRKNYEIIVVSNFNDKNIDEFILQNSIKSIYTDDTSLSGKLAIGIKNSSGNVISFLDDDDMFTEDKLEYIYNKFTDKVAYIHNNYITINKNGNKINYRNKGIDFNMSSISIRKDVINSNVSKINRLLDAFMYFSAIGNGKIIKSKKVLTYYRLYDGNTSQYYTKEEIKDNTKNIIIGYKQLYDLFDRKVKKIISSRITAQSIALHIEGENIEVKGFINYILTYDRDGSILYKLLVLAVFEIYRSKFGRKIVNKKLDTYIEHLNKIVRST